MKQGGLLLSGFLLIASLMPVVAQDNDANYQTYMVESFDSPDSNGWTWQATGSKFISKGFPVLKYFEGMPRVAKAMYGDSEDPHQFLGVQFKFNRQGDNWVDIYPVKDDKPYEIPFKGVVKRFDLWVWGAGYDYTLELLVRDSRGIIKVLPLGKLNFKGWKNLSVNVPSSISQVSPYLSDTKFMSFVTFRIRTNPNERVDEFYVFLDEFKALTDVYLNSYDGYELEKADFTQEN